MKLGAFSVSLSVSDIAASRTFYEALGFEAFGGDITQNWLILRNGSSVIGLFQGMFEGNMMTFNPGWDQNASALDSFDDIRAIQAQVKAAGIDVPTEAAPAETGPASFMVTDPDGNVILLDQHVNAPGA